MSNFEFADPYWLFLLLLIPVFIFGRLMFTTRTSATVKSPSLKAFAHTSAWMKYLKPFLFFVRLVAFGLLVLAMARPRTVDVATKVSSDEGVDIMMVVDVSLSMLARDLKPTRLNALQQVAEDFVTNRTTDRIGLVVYSGEAVTKVPLTTDRTILRNEIADLKTDELEGGTAIGVGLATAINNLKDSKAKSKVVILITDGGESNTEHALNKVYVSPETAAEIAKEKDIKVYTIGIGTTGFIPLPRGYEHYPQSLFRLDEGLLKYIANTANGRYFRATDNQKLEEIYSEINQLEKSEINEVKYYSYKEYFRAFLIPGLLLLLFELVLRTVVYKELT